MQKHCTHILALLLSIVVHLGVGYALGSSAPVVKSALSRSDHDSRVVVFLSAPDAEREKVADADRVIRGAQSTEKIGGHVLAPTAAQVQQTKQQSPILPIAMPVAPYYFLPDELTEAAKVERDISPNLVFSMPNGYSQLAVLRLLINEQGDIDQVVMESSDLPEQTQDLMRDVFKKTKFQPGKIDGANVKSQLRVEVMLEDLNVKEIKRIDLPAALDAASK